MGTLHYRVVLGARQTNDLTFLLMGKLLLMTLSYLDT
jgi:hypothetical protein